MICLFSAHVSAKPSTSTHTRGDAAMHSAAKNSSTMHSNTSASANSQQDGYYTNTDGIASPRDDHTYYSVSPDQDDEYYSAVTVTYDEANPV